MTTNWPPPEDLDTVASPGLLVDVDAVAGNLQRMVEMIGGRKHVARLRPHVKTHKMPDVVRMNLDLDITRFKAATIAEAEMVAGAGGQDILVSYQLVGPNIARMAALVDRFPNVSFAAITDDITAAHQMVNQIGTPRRPLRLFIDVDCGMHRTGIEFGPALDQLRDQLDSLQACEYRGLHVYDGHLHAPSAGGQP